MGIELNRNGGVAGWALRTLTLSTALPWDWTRFHRNLRGVNKFYNAPTVTRGGYELAKITK
jgi:hypothetical protein